MGHAYRHEFRELVSCSSNIQIIARLFIYACGHVLREPPRKYRALEGRGDARNTSCQIGKKRQSHLLMALATGTQRLNVRRKQVASFFGRIACELSTMLHKHASFCLPSGV